MKPRVAVLGACLLLTGLVAGVFADSPPASAPAPSDDVLLDQARRYVEASDRYLHHAKVRRGMKGYGLTVMAGTDIVRFDAEIISVMGKWGPHADVILARLSGQGLEHSGVVAGMSGSPVYVVDPADGKSKLIGAVAYGWNGSKDPICGIQPITQMLAIEDVLSEITAPAGPSTAPTTRAVPAIVESDGPAFDPGTDELATAMSASPAARPWRAEAPATAPLARLMPLRTPLSTTGLDEGALTRASEILAPLGFVPLQAGAVTATQAKALQDVRLVPGAAVSVCLASGDMDLSAIGTVTDVVGNHVLAFGHPFFRQGDLKLPMGTAYIHTVIPGIGESFKLGSTLAIAGTLRRDEGTGVAGRIGQTAPTIPMTVRVAWTGRQRVQTFHFDLCQQTRLTPMILEMLLSQAIAGSRMPQEFSHAKYTLAIDLGTDLGTYEASNLLSGPKLAMVIDDATTPIHLVMRNRFARPPRIRGIRMDLEIADGDITGLIEDLRLDGQIYRPGETITGHATIRPTRRPKVSMDVSFELPPDLPEGQYTLTACDAGDSLHTDMRESPHLYVPQSLPQLVAALRRAAGRSNGDLFLRLPLPETGLALRQAEPPQLPPSVAGAINEARPFEARPFTRSLVRSLPTPYVVEGSVAATFTVAKRPAQTLIRQQKEPAP
ncbi:MAG: hypothetical protein NTV86_13145 [Planctomycetota bacterium]|nr:hypothetical protein [Planctomycetota bacterium]